MPCTVEKHEKPAAKAAQAMPDRGGENGASCSVGRWSAEEARAIYNLPFNDLLFRAHGLHRENFDPNRIQLSKLLNIKTGGCPEDCGYCSQSASAENGLKASKLMEIETVLEEARKAKAAGATRYCMGAAWRSPKDRDMPALTHMIDRKREGNGPGNLHDAGDAG